MNTCVEGGGRQAARVLYLGPRWTRVVTFIHRTLHSRRKGHVTLRTGVFFKCTAGLDRMVKKGSTARFEIQAPPVNSEQPEGSRKLRFPDLA